MNCNSKAACRLWVRFGDTHGSTRQQCYAWRAAVFFAYLTLTSNNASATQTLIAQDTFARADQAQWGTASDGHAWGADAAISSTFAIASGSGTITNPSAILSGTLGPTTTDGQVVATGSISSFSGGDYGVALRYTDANNWYKAYIDGTHLVIRKMVAGVNSEIAQTAFTASDATAYTIRFQIVGDVLYAKAWAASDSEPAGWMITTTDSSHLGAGHAGVQAYGFSSVTSYTSFAAYTVSDANSGTISIDYATPVRTLDPLAVGMDIAGYYTPDTFATDTLEQSRLHTLNPAYYRLNLKYSTTGDASSKIVCGNSGCDDTPDGDQWVTTVKNAGGEPVIVVPETTASDAANMVKHFNVDTDNHVQYWVVGNEPDINGISAADYSTDFNAFYDAMKAVDPTIKVGGGTTAFFDYSYLQTFLEDSGTRVDFVDYHGYAQQGTSDGDPAGLFQYAQQFRTNVNGLRTLIATTVPTRAADIFIEIGEYELNWGGSAQDDTNSHALWTASVLGNILSAGGRAMFFADKGNLFYHDTRTITDAYGHDVTVNLDDTNPAYHGIGMFTGEGLFPAFGTKLVATATSFPNVEVFASDNPKNIVVINEDPSNAQTATFTLSGIDSGTASVWRKDESVLFPDPPTHVDTATISDGSMTYALPPLSLTTFVVTPSSSSGSGSSGGSSGSSSGSGSTASSHDHAQTPESSSGSATSPKQTTKTPATTYATVHIAVTDASGKPLPSLTVVMNVNGTPKNAITDLDGVATFVHIPAGQYRITIVDTVYSGSQLITITHGRAAGFSLIATRASTAPVTRVDHARNGNTLRTVLLGAGSAVLLGAAIAIFAHIIRQHRRDNRPAAPVVVVPPQDTPPPGTISASVG